MSPGIYVPGPPWKISIFFALFWIFPVQAKNGSRWPQMGPGIFFPTNPDLADTLGDTDFDFENFYFLLFLDPKFPDFQVPDFQKSDLGPGLGLGPGWAPRLGPLAGPGWAPFGWAGWAYSGGSLEATARN